MSAPGYSGKPVAEKLGLKHQAQLFILDCPLSYHDLIPGIPEGAEIRHELEPDAEFIHLFVTSAGRLACWAPRVAASLAPKGMLWVSWPKKASKVQTDITEQTLRDVLLPTGLVDVKVCAVSEVWSGLKFLWRKS